MFARKINQQQWCPSSLDPQALGTKTTKGQAFRPSCAFSHFILQV